MKLNEDQTRPEIIRYLVSIHGMTPTEANMLYDARRSHELPELFEAEFVGRLATGPNIEASCARVAEKMVN